MDDIVQKICQIIFDRKGCNVLALDVRTLSTLTDFFIIAEGLADRHVQSLADNIAADLESFGYTPIHVEGKAEGEWVVLDYSTVVVHLFAPGLRDYYRLEELWKEGSLVSLELPSENVACR